ncbi:MULTISPECIES: Na+/H+ antiporter [Nocardia]|uniref:Na+/H+ antiporter n=1 Tax=Nocardia nova TaxID=37330 RepID=A0A2S5ZYA3_9NOCA|nr:MULTISPECIES: Na+/H+ antiporter [Nocardia]OBF80375.1 Na+/H+ antiporter [Mycobacterium sp. 852002-51759_SCH5129042]MBF6277375.1 Na+/H+ antiporter [Nocardia nova]OBA50624.1 Na+/H+ antiporter [Nocardia sp. 852002-51101_SCH5132738]OBB41186.1 Na+/H+ antiporter [Nocardia sp. 852002-51244_SCH5132740]PPJ12170.1 Na+/H+ antiporter [Nocardia nova]
MDQLVLVFVLAFATILAQPLGRRLGLAPAVLMTVFGLVMAVLPFVPNIALAPELILPLVLPPLLYASARRTSWQQFASNAGAILLRAVGLVVATAAAVAAIFHLWYPALPVGTAFALGAVVAPPDPVAVSAMANRLGLPRRLVAVLEGEGLFNDVTAVVIYDVAVQAVVTGQFSAWRTAVDFVVSAVVAMAVGLALGWAGSALMRRLTEAPWQVALGLLLPFAAYGLAEAAHGSAVLAVLVCALYLTDAATDFSDVGYRIVGDSFWDVIDMLVTGFAFGLVGLELSTVLATTGPNWPRLLGGAAAVVGVVVALRVLWLLASTALFRGWWRRRRVDEPYTWRETVVTWWAGMRGVVTVALALALPLTTDSGADFPGRTEVLFIAFVVVLFTLLLQGPTLPLVARWTGVKADTEVERAMERRLWTRILRAELARLEDIADTEDLPDEVYQRLRDSVERRLMRADPEAAQAADGTKTVEHAMRLTGKLRTISNDVLDAGRGEALAARREPGMPPDLVDRVMRRLDLRPPPLL